MEWNARIYTMHQKFDDDAKNNASHQDIVAGMLSKSKGYGWESLAMAVREAAPDGT
jgi:hypothetical protein